MAKHTQSRSASTAAIEFVMIERETGLKWLRKEAALGFAQLDVGEYEELNREQFLKRVTKRRAT